MPAQSQHESGNTTFIIPDSFARWPWQRRLNPFYTSVKADSEAWFKSYGMYGPEAQRAFDLCDFCRLVALAHPNQNAEQFRVTCDWMQVFFAFDDIAEAGSEESVKEMATCVINAMRGTHLPHGCIFGEMTTDFWQRLIVIMPNAVYQRRFIELFQEYVNAIVQEVQDRHRGHIRDVEAYLKLRRGTGGTPVCLALVCMGLDLPEEIFEDPHVQQVEALAADLVTINNDMVSYNIEQHRGYNHNLVSIGIVKNNWTLQQAMDWADQHCQSMMAEVEVAKAAIPSFGKYVDHELAQYIEGLCNWVKACDAWSFEGQRYFGDLGPAIQKHRQVVLRR